MRISDQIEPQAVQSDQKSLWPFRIACRRRLVRVAGRVRTDSTAAANTAVACGAGIGFAPLWLVRSLVDRGEVEIILEDFEWFGYPTSLILERET